MRKLNKSGFTLIELLVVIAIIGTLAAIVMVNLSPVTKQSNDTKRIADLKNLSLALGLYYNDNGSYPTNLSALKPNYMAELPLDPVTGAQYDYAGTATDYVLRAKLDGDHKVLNQDVDGTKLGVDCSDSPVKYYCVSP